jgi:glycosyltransferase involved in cell wall biosynthesis
MVDTALIPPTAAPETQARLRIALAHDWLCGLRGGELVLECIADLITREHEPAGVFTMFDDGQPLSPTVDSLPHFVSRVGRWPGATRLRRWLLPMYPRAVAELSILLEREHSRKAIDLVISTSSAAIKGLRTPRGVPHLCYCHSPARYVWSQTEEYAGGLRGLGLSLWGERFRRWDAASAANVTRFLANSEYTARQVARCYQRGAEVVHPPLRPMFLGVSAREEHGDGRPWLVVAALEPYKRIELAIDAANRSEHSLVVIGGGSMRAELEAMAGPTVQFLGRVDDAELISWYSRSRLLLFPQVEDFGLVAIEAQACGLPVVARRDGGALETVVDGVTGAFFGEPTPRALLEAIAKCPDRCAAACRENAARFTPSRFDQAMREQIAATLRAARSPAAV